MNFPSTESILSVLGAHLSRGDAAMEYLRRLGGGRADEACDSIIRYLVTEKTGRALTVYSLCTPGGTDLGELLALPSGKTVRVIHAAPCEDPSRISLTLEDSGAVESGDILCGADAPAAQSDMFALTISWLGDEPFFPGRTYRLLSLSGARMALAGKLKTRLDISQDGGETRLAASKISKGELGEIEIELDGGIIHDAAPVNSPLSWVLFTDSRGDVAGIGRIRFSLRRASNIRWQEMKIGREQRARSLGQKPVVLWFTGLSGCGKSTIASCLEQRLHDMGKHAYVLDGDNVRHGLCKDLGFTQADRIENMRRITEVAKLFVDAGLIVLVSFISPFRSERERARQAFEKGEFIEVFVDTPLEVCEARDIKGLYAKARAGLIRNFTGIDSPYEAPENPEIHLRGPDMTPEEMADYMLDEMARRGLLNNS